MTGISAAIGGVKKASPEVLSAIILWLSHPVDIGPLVVLRVAFGVLTLVGTVRFAAQGWIRELYVLPGFHFTYYGFDWVRPLPVWGMYLVFIVLAALSMCIAAGLFYRFSMAGFFVLFTYIELLDKTNYLNHYYFISLFSLLLLFLPLNGRFALDNRLGLAPVRPAVPAWMVWVVCVQLGLVYFFAGLAKINHDWLLEAQPLRIWLQARASMPLLGGLFDHKWVGFVMSWAGMIFDLTVFFWLSWPRSRAIAYLGVIFFHSLTGLLFHIGMFPWIMIACTLVFFDWRLPAPVEADLSTGRNERKPSAADSLSALTAGLIVVWLGIQVLLPLRHWLYPGDVNWTEEGGRFAWRVMLVEKTGQATFFVRDKDTGGETIVFPADYLTDLQEIQMSFQPDMIVQFARFLARQYDGNVAVRAEVYVSWNGRASRLLIDPDYDLLNASLISRSKPWILR